MFFRLANLLSCPVIEHKFTTISLIPTGTFLVQRHKMGIYVCFQPIEHLHTYHRIAFRTQAFSAVSVCLFAGSVLLVYHGWSKVLPWLPFKHNLHKSSAYVATNKPLNPKYIAIRSLMNVIVFEITRATYLKKDLPLKSTSTTWQNRFIIWFVRIHWLQADGSVLQNSTQNLKTAPIIQTDLQPSTLTREIQLFGSSTNKQKKNSSQKSHPTSNKYALAPLQGRGFIFFKGFAKRRVHLCRYRQVNALQPLWFSE